jgi:ribonuclease P protein subunit POP4
MMPIKPQNILRHELIGLKAVVSRSSNDFLAGIQGHIVDETRNTIRINTKKGPKMIPKDVATFVFKLQDGSNVEVDGSRLIGRPENRMKNRTRKW